MKKKILILGNSSFFQRRILPSIKKIKNLEIYICSKSSKKNTKKKIFFNNYNLALIKNTYNLVYISLINDLHFKYAKRSLELGYNVVVDKPITLKYDQTIELAKLAKKKNVLLIELTMFNYHKVFNEIIKLIGGLENLEYLETTFNIPGEKNIKKYHIKKNDCLNDMSPYSAALIRLFLKGKIERFLVKKKYFKNNKRKTVKEFSVCVFNKKTHLVSNFGINKEYQSKITFYGARKIISIPFQAFALSSQKKVSVHIKDKNKIKKITIFDDYIKRFFEKILFTKNYNYHRNNLIKDNKIKSKLNLFS